MAIEVTTTAISDIERTTAISGGTVTGDLGSYIPLVDILMGSEFQEHNKSRQMLSGPIKEVSILKPFQMFTDNKQSAKPFLLTSFRMKVLEDAYDIELTEYNNSDVINLI